MPNLRTNASGTSWQGGSMPGTSLPITAFHIVRPGDTAASRNAAPACNRHLLFTPGVHHVDRTLTVPNPDTVILGVGYPTTIIPDNTAHVVNGTGGPGQGTATVPVEVVSYPERTGGVPFSAASFDTPGISTYNSVRALSEGLSGSAATGPDRFLTAARSAPSHQGPPGSGAPGGPAFPVTVRRRRARSRAAV